MKCDNCEYKIICGVFGQEEGLIQDCLKETELENKVNLFKEMILKHENFINKESLKDMKNLADELCLGLKIEYTDEGEVKKVTYTYLNNIDPQVKILFEQDPGGLTTPQRKQFQIAVMRVVERFNLPFTEVIGHYTSKTNPSRIAKCSLTIPVKEILENRKIDRQLKSIVASTDEVKISLRQRLLDIVTETKNEILTQKIKDTEDTTFQIPEAIVNSVSKQYFDDIELYLNSTTINTSDEKAFIALMYRLRCGLTALRMSTPEIKSMCPEALVYTACSFALLGIKNGKFTMIENELKG